MIPWIFSRSIETMLTYKKYLQSLMRYSYNTNVRYATSAIFKSNILLNSLHLHPNKFQLEIKYCHAIILAFRCPRRVFIPYYLVGGSSSFKQFWAIEGISGKNNICFRVGGLVLKYFCSQMCVCLINRERVK